MAQTCSDNKFKLSSLENQFFWWPILHIEGCTATATTNMKPCIPFASKREIGPSWVVAKEPSRAPFLGNQKEYYATLHGSRSQDSSVWCFQNRAMSLVKIFPWQPQRFTLDTFSVRHHKLHQDHLQDAVFPKCGTMTEALELCTNKIFHTN